MSVDLRNLLERKSWILVEKFVENFDKDRDECQIQVWVQGLDTDCDLDAVYAEFFTLREKVEVLLDDDDEEADDTEQAAREQENIHAVEKLENRFCKLKSDLLKLLPAKEQTTHETHHQQSTATLSKVKLPEISLPSFSDKLRERVMFHDTFRSLIHQNPQLNPMDEFT